MRHFDFLNCAILLRHLCVVRCGLVCGRAGLAVEVDNMAALCQSQDSWLLAKLLPSKTNCLAKWKLQHCR